MRGRDLKALVFAAVMAAVFGAASARAAECGTGAEGFDDWLKSFKQVAINNGVSREVVDAALGGVTYDPSVKAHDHGVAAFGSNFTSFAASHASPGMVGHAQNHFRRPSHGACYRTRLASGWPIIDASERRRIDPGAEIQR